MMTISLLLLLAYLLGSVSGSLWLGKLRGVDIRTLGSGNAGGTNALRTQGWRFGLGVALIDVGKGVLAAWLAWYFAPEPYRMPVAYAATALAMIGHIWPVFHGFRGGKGAATLIGGLIIAWPLALLPLLGTWALVLTMSGYVGLSTVLAGMALPVLAWWSDAGLATVLFAAGVAMLMLYTHRGNLQRLREGRENRFERARLWVRLWARLRRA